MKRICSFLTAIIFMAWTSPAMGQLIDAQPCQFYNIDKTVIARLGEGEDAFYQQNSIKAFWPVMLNGKECPKLQEALCYWLTDKEDIKQMDRAVEYTMYIDNENVPFGEGAPYILLDALNDDHPTSINANTIELHALSNRFATFHLTTNMYFAGAAHGMYVHNYLTYDTELDRIVTLEDILVDPELIRPHILKSINLKYDYTEEDLFLPEDNIMPIPKVFYFDEGFLHLVYQVYEIASFAQGDIDVPIFYPNDGISPEYLTPYGQEVMKASITDDLY